MNCAVLLVETHKGDANSDAKGHGFLEIFSVDVGLVIIVEGLWHDGVSW